MVSPLGFEPRTRGLKVPCSATELRARTVVCVKQAERIDCDQVQLIPDGTSSTTALYANPQVVYALRAALMADSLVPARN